MQKSNWVYVLGLCVFILAVQSCSAPKKADTNKSTTESTSSAKPTSETSTGKVQNEQPSSAAVIDLSPDQLKK
jgi:hypothetical protein